MICLPYPCNNCLSISYFNIADVKKWKQQIEAKKMQLMERAKQELDRKRSQLEDEMEQVLGKRDKNFKIGRKKNSAVKNVTGRCPSMYVTFLLFLIIHAEGTASSGG